MTGGLTSALHKTARDVLIVEDEARVRTMLEQALKAMGYATTLAGSAEAAGKVLASRAFDILMLDLNLPGMNGIEFLEKIRRQHPELAVIILTGFGDLEAARKAIHLDVVDFLTKPCALGALELALDRASKRRRGALVGEVASTVPATAFESDAPRKAFAVHGADSAAGAESMEDLERKHILAALHRHNGNRAEAAAELGISVRKLYYRLGEYQKQGLFP